MSLYPFFIDYDQPRHRSRLYDQHFGLGLTPQDYLTVIIPQMKSQDYYGPWRNPQAQECGSTIKEDKNKFQVSLDIQHFSPEEISVKTVDGCLVIEAKHEEKQDEHGFVSRSFVRKYPLPEGVDADLVTSKLSSDGVLSITAPLKAPPKVENERIVPIVRTGPVKKQTEDEKVEEKVEEKEK